MENCAINEERKLLQCAFEKFHSLRYPFSIETRVYLSDHINLLHCHDFPQLWYCLSGIYTHQIEGRAYECAKGSLVVIPAGVAHKIQIQNEAKILRLDAMFDLFQDAHPEKYTNSIANLFLYAFAQELGFHIPLYRMLSYESQAKIEEYLSWLSVISISAPGRIEIGDIRDQLEAIFSLPEIAIAEEYRKKTEWLAQIRLHPIVRVLSYMNLHSTEKITEEELLQASATCRTDLYQYFKRFTGYACMVYLKWLRIRKAFLYLTHTTYPLSYISDICGFSDLPHMSRSFSRFMGVTPKTLRIEQRKWLEDYPQDKVYSKIF